jgi:hypothetical protein
MAGRQLNEGELYYIAVKPVSGGVHAGISQKSLPFSAAYLRE